MRCWQHGPALSSVSEQLAIGRTKTICLLATHRFVYTRFGKQLPCFWAFPDSAGLENRDSDGQFLGTCWTMLVLTLVHCT